MYRNFDCKTHQLTALATDISNLATQHGYAGIPAPCSENEDLLLRLAMSSSYICSVEEGNELFQNGDFEGAAAAYSAVLGTDPSEQDSLRCLANRSACYLKLGRHAACIEDASQVLRAEPKHFKALCRRAQARLGTVLPDAESCRSACADLALALAIDPTVSRLGAQLRRACTSHTAARCRTGGICVTWEKPEEEGEGQCWLTAGRHIATGEVVLAEGGPTGRPLLAATSAVEYWAGEWN